MKLALVHDYLTQRGGAERVFLSICRAFPDASIHTSLYEPELTFPEFAQFDIRTTPLNRVRAFRRHHRLALPFFASAFSRLEVDADVVLCSSSGWAHGVNASGRKIVYCYNPARWLYQTNEYAGQGMSASSAAIRAVGGSLRRWDVRSADSAEKYVVISDVVRRRVRAAYGIEAEVVAPPTTVDIGGSQTPIRGIRPGFFLCVSRLLRYKNVEAIVDAFRLLPDERLVVVGKGPMEKQLRSALPPNVQLLGGVGDAELRWLYGGAQALVAASYEDFGLTPVEAMAFGKPSVVLRYGGFLETVVDRETGVFFGEPTADAIIDAVRELQQNTFVPGVLTSRAAEFSEEVFTERLNAIVSERTPSVDQVAVSSS